MSRVVLCLSGRIASGKSSVATALADQRRAAMSSFGAFVRAQAVMRGLDSNVREVLQDLGAQLITENGSEWLCREVIAESGWSPQQSGDLVLDGIRHVEVFDVIKRLVGPTKALLVYLEMASASDTDSRDSLRGLTAEDRARFEQHSTERDVLVALRNAADLVLSANAPIEDILSAIEGLIRHELN